MNFNEYQQLAQRTANMHGTVEKLMNAALGLAGESGEVADYVKKWAFQDHSFEGEKIIEEIGDILWYIAEAATALNITLESVAQYNIDKLRKRYPAGFNSERSINREV